MELQLAPIYGMISDDVNDDGFLDVVGVGNDFGTEVSMGRYDALNGFVLLGDGKGEFKSMAMQNSGINVKGDGKALVTLLNDSGDYYLIASQNRGILKSYHQKISSDQILSLDPNVVSIAIETTDGKKIKREIYYGSGFLSQSSRKIRIPRNVKSIESINFKGEVKKLL